MTGKVVLIAVLAVRAWPASFAAAQQPSAALRQDFDQLLQAAERARDENRDDDAISLFRRVLSQRRESEEAEWYLGTLFYEKEQYAEARDVLRQFVTIRPDAGPGWALLGICEFQLKEYSHALDHLQRAMALGVEDRKELRQSAFYDLAVLLTRFERYDESMEVLQRLVDPNSPDPSLIVPAGLAGLRMPFLPAEIPPDRRELINLAGKAVLAVQTERYEEADSAFKRLVATYPNEPGVHFLFGAYLAQLHPDQAAPEFERELDISHSHVLARVRLAEQLIAQRDFDRALALAEQAIKLDPKRASAHMLAGEALIGNGNAANGMKELETARAGGPDVSRIHWDLLRAYSAAGRKDDASREKLEIERLLHANASPRPQQLGDSPHDSPPPQ